MPPSFFCLCLKFFLELTNILCILFFLALDCCSLLRRELRLLTNCGFQHIQLSISSLNLSFQIATLMRTHVRLEPVLLLPLSCKLILLLPQTRPELGDADRARVEFLDGSLGSGEFLPGFCQALVVLRTFRSHGAASPTPGLVVSLGLLHNRCKSLALDLQPREIFLYGVPIGDQLAQGIRARLHISKLTLGAPAPPLISPCRQQSFIMFCIGDGGSPATRCNERCRTHRRHPPSDGLALINCGEFALQLFSC
mmetsp:Transcript_92374/g.298536  ORF Transcript_92374/g.298536 Transcript_92374/m.298536 type:complete len:253 (-) Transcript_92374:2265-3023(-)